MFDVLEVPAEKVLSKQVVQAFCSIFELTMSTSLSESKLFILEERFAKYVELELHVPVEYSSVSVVRLLQLGLQHSVIR